MEAPDKIYLQYGYYPVADTETINSDWTEHPVQDFENIAYIRKDALLEWAKEWKERYPYSHEFQMIIDKINSL